MLVDLTNGAPLGVPPTRLPGDRGERGVYIFFDALNWRRERRLLELDYESLDPPRVVGGAGGAGPSALGLGSAQQLQIGGGGQQSGGGVSGGGSSQILPS